MEFGATCCTSRLTIVCPIKKPMGSSFEGVSLNSTLSRIAGCCEDVLSNPATAVCPESEMVCTCEVVFFMCTTPTAPRIVFFFPISTCKFTFGYHSSCNISLVSSLCQTAVLACEWVIHRRVNMCFCYSALTVMLSHYTACLCKGESVDSLLQMQIPTTGVCHQPRTLTS